MDNTTDDFGAFHIYHDDDGRCEAVEFFDDVAAEVAGSVAFPVTPEEAQRVIPLWFQTATISSLSRSLSGSMPWAERRKASSLAQRGITCNGRSTVLLARTRVVLLCLIV